MFNIFTKRKISTVVVYKQKKISKKRKTEKKKYLHCTIYKIVLNVAAMQ